MGNYRKALAQVAATAAAATVAALTGDSRIDAGEWVSIALIGLGAVGVFLTPNTPNATHAKTLVAALTAALVVAQTAVQNGVTINEWWQIAAAGLGALGVWALPNTPPTPTVSDNFEGNTL